MSYPFDDFLGQPSSELSGKRERMKRTDLDRLSSQNDKRLCALHEESGEFVCEDPLDLVGLLDADAQSDAVDACLDEHPLVFISRNDERRQEGLFRRARFHLGLVVPLDVLRRKVLQRQCGSQ